MKQLDKFSQRLARRVSAYEEGALGCLEIVLDFVVAGFFWCYYAYFSLPGRQFNDQAYSKHKITKRIS